MFLVLVQVKHKRCSFLVNNDLNVTNRLASEDLQQPYFFSFWSRPVYFKVKEWFAKSARCFTFVFHRKRKTHIKCYEHI